MRSLQSRAAGDVGAGASGARQGTCEAAQAQAHTKTQAGRTWRIMAPDCRGAVAKAMLSW